MTVAADPDVATNELMFLHVDIAARPRRPDTGAAPSALHDARRRTCGAARAGHCWMPHNDGGAWLIGTAAEGLAGRVSRLSPLWLVSTAKPGPPA
jgi:hypothetical protein